jgi:hypothetical protein
MLLILVDGRRPTSFATGKRKCIPMGKLLVEIYLNSMKCGRRT